MQASTLLPIVIAELKVHLHQRYLTTADFTARVQISPPSLPLSTASPRMHGHRCLQLASGGVCGQIAVPRRGSLALCSSADEHTSGCAKAYADATKREVSFPFPFPTRNVFALQPTLGSLSLSCQIPLPREEEEEGTCAFCAPCIVSVPSSSISFRGGWNHLLRATNSACLANRLEPEFKASPDVNVGFIVESSSGSGQVKCFLAIWFGPI
ncbi:hypothetical protein OPV22_004775 [Ensete ventricosum]|uniref:Uncharacterized protein n=1 Tax=Ensete ventricosum TaxID=4639 RepID=A0AAV8RJJ2_ENSVE|nr:hypothetical protein OPV22_004775 [Ensete ventricosum]